MVSCTVCSCTKSVKITNMGITFHRFPKDTKRRKMWIKFINQKNWEPKPNSYVCSQHFTLDSFDKSSKVKVLLHPEAVPTIHRNINNEHVSSSKTDALNFSNDEIESENDDNSNTLFNFDVPIKNEKDCDPLSEFNNVQDAGKQSSVEEKLRSDLIESRKECEQLRKKLKTYQKCTTKYVKKIEKLKTIVRFLRESNKYVMAMKKNGKYKMDNRNIADVKLEDVLGENTEEI